MAAHGKTAMPTATKTQQRKASGRFHPDGDHDSSSSSSSWWWNRMMCDVVLNPKSDWFWVPKRYFTHFYVVGLMHLFVCVCFCCNRRLIFFQSKNHVILLCLLVLHLLRRWIECSWIHAWSESSRMHLGGYCLGMLHYLLLPLVFWNVSCNGVKDDMRMLVSDLDEKEAAGTRVSLVGGSMALLCIWAQYQQNRHHRILACLRNHRQCRHETLKPSRSSDNHHANYAIPFGAWFQWVSCPHYLAEIIIYFSWAVLVADSSNGVAAGHHPRGGRQWILLAWVADNLIVSAISSHRWYTEMYSNEYTKLNRRAILPGLL